jgi:hypothetical protein
MESQHAETNVHVSQAMTIYKSSVNHTTLQRMESSTNVEAVRYYSKAQRHEIRRPSSVLGLLTRAEVLDLPILILIKTLKLLKDYKLKITIKNVELITPRDALARLLNYEIIDMMHSIPMGSAVTYQVGSSITCSELSKLIG